MTKTWDCPKCGKCFTSQHGTRDHIRDAHGGGIDPRKRKRAPVRDDSDMSLADIAVEAELKRLMGEPLDALEESLLND